MKEDKMINTFKAGDKVLYCGKKYKIDLLREDGTAKIHSVYGKDSEICLRARVKDFEKC